MKEITAKKAQIDITNGFSAYCIHNEETTELRLYADKGTNGELLIAYDGTQADLHIDVEAQADCELRMLFWNRITDKLSFHLTMNEIGNSTVHIAVADLEECAADYHITSTLSTSDASVQVTTVCMAKHKHWLMKMNHHHEHTHSVMRNFAVVDENGDYRMEAGGVIQKGAYESSTHQQTRVLTMSENQKSEVLPILLIDENEVKASHATTLGQPDADQLYYLQSRGLTLKQALGLMKLGYLFPITEIFTDAELQKQLRRQVEEKVMNHD